MSIFPKESPVSRSDGKTTVQALHHWRGLNSFLATRPDVFSGLINFKRDGKKGEE